MTMRLSFHLLVSRGSSKVDKQQRENYVFLVD